MADNIEWLIIGSRRWARVIASEICKLPSPPRLVKIYDDTQDPHLVQWVQDSSYKNNLKITNQIEICSASKTGIAIIVNSAYLHPVSIKRALEAGYHVISEKPLTLSRLETIGLREKAKQLGLELFSTNTYLFANYLKILKEKYIGNKKISEIYIHWADPLSEVRYGEKKSYDSSTPIIYDVLPHIVAVVLATYGDFQVNKSSIKVLRGGSEVKLSFIGEGLCISMSLERNSLRRKRIIQFAGEGPDIIFNFTEEPGQILLGGDTPILLDHEWEDKRKPLAQMLCSLEKYFKEGIHDARLSSDAAILANNLIDSVADDYVKQLESFLSLPHKSGIEEEVNFIYAKKEVTSLNERVLPYLSIKSPLRRLAFTAPTNSVDKNEK